MKHEAAMVRKNALVWARSQIGSRKYGIDTWNGVFVWGTAKCNLFVAHAFGFSNGARQLMLETPSKNLSGIGVGRMRLLSAREIYNGRLLKFNLVKDPEPGDICADGLHVGIVSGKGKTISASSITGTVVENDWGFRTGNGRPQRNARFFRYVGR